MKIKRAVDLVQHTSKFCLLFSIFKSHLLFSNILTENNTQKCEDITFLYKNKKPTQEIIPIVKLIENFFKSNGENNLYKKFHPRLNVSPKILTNQYHKFNYTLGKPINVNIFKIWYLRNLQENSQYINCSKSGIQFKKTYGYPYQYSLWIQLLGSKELGILYLSLVPKENSIYINDFSIQKWTHISKDYKGWAIEAQQSYSENKKTLAYIQFDIAKKLANGRNKFIIDAEEDLENKKKHIFSHEIFTEKIKNIINYKKHIKVSTIFTKKNIGIQILLDKKKYKNSDQLKESCKKIHNNFLKNKELNTLDNLNCGYHDKIAQKNLFFNLKKT